jgi:NAD(P)-dependent dehydrogenase (short-subunit alcohol dehydrogenase family)
VAATEAYGPAVSGLLRGRRILVTGAASGIGGAVSLACEQAGATVLGTDLVAAGKIERCDVRSEHEVISLFSRQGTTLTDVIHCAGIAESGPIEELSVDRWNAMIATNLTGSFLVGRESARYLKGPGSITFIASAGGLKGSASWTAYVASKFGVVGLMRSLAQELAPRRLRVNAVCPGGVRTPMVDKTVTEIAEREGLTEETVRRAENEVVPLGRLAEPGEVANVCVFLASDLAAHVAGAALLVDGAQLA